MSTRDIFWGVKVAGAQVYNLTAFMCLLSISPENLNLLECSRPVQTCTGIA